METPKEARRNLAHRTRRIIMNNDGDDVIYAEHANVESFLAQRFTGLEDSQVDSIFYSDGVFNLYSRPSKISEFASWGGRSNRFLDKGLIPLQMAIDFCRKNRKEIFWSMRMNDTHDVSEVSHRSQWKMTNPQLTMAPEAREFPYGGNRWCALNYEEQEVRERALALASEVISKYDVDGIELDFFRHPVYFLPQMTGEKVTQEQCDLMTDLLRKIRTVTDEVGAVRKRPFLLAVRVPDSLGYAKAIGLDLVVWLQEDLIDLLVETCYFHLEPWEISVALGRQYDVPVYPCLSGSRLVDPAYPEESGDIEIFRGEALKAWEAGANGIYLFNRFDPHDPLFREVGDPELLKTLTWKDQIMIGEDMIEYWLKDGKQFLKL